MQKQLLKMISAAFAGLLIVFSCLPAGAQTRPADSLHLFFDWGKSTLTPATKEKINRSLYDDFFQAGRFLILGYTDASGSDSQNLLLSKARVTAIQSYLKDSLSLSISYTGAVSNGESSANLRDEKDWRDRVVIIVRFKSESIAVNQQNPDSAVAVRAFHKRFIGKCTNCPPDFVDYTNRVNEDAYRIFKEKQLDRRSGTGLKPVPVNQAYIFRTRGSADLFSKKSLLKQVFNSRTGWNGGAAVELALNYAVAGKKDSVFYLLNRTLDSCANYSQECSELWQVNTLGFYQFRPYYQSREWTLFETRLLKRYRQTQAASSEKYLPLLLAAGADQSVRFTLYTADSKLPDAQRQIARANLSLIRHYLAREGYPNRVVTGTAVEEAAFLLVQHSEDTALQRQALSAMQQLMHTGAADKENVALLTDRLQVATKGTQVFGTQFKPDGTSYPIEDVGHLNERRAAYGLSAFQF